MTTHAEKTEAPETKDTPPPPLSRRLAGSKPGPDEIKEAVGNLKKMLSSAEMAMIFAPIAGQGLVKDLKEIDPEAYYQFKTVIRDFIFTMEKCLPEFKKTLEELT